MDQKKDDNINKLDSDLKTLETKNLELKYTNRNLISTLNKEKNMVKTLKSKISELESSKVKEHAFEKLNKEHEKLLDEYNKLQIEYNKSQNKISQLKDSIPKSNQDKGLLGRFLKRKTLDEKDNNLEDHMDDKSKK